LKRIATLAFAPVASLVLSTFVLVAPAHAQGDCGAGAMPFDDTASGSLTDTDGWDWWSTFSNGTTLVTIDTESDQTAIMVEPESCNETLCTDAYQTHYTCLVRNYQGRLSIYVGTLQWPADYSTYTIHVDKSPANPTVPAQCGDGLDNDPDYPADSGCTSATDDDESSPAPPSSCNVVDTAGVCVEVRTGDVVTQQTLYDVVTTTTATRSVAGYLDAYRFSLPTGGSVVMPCVTLTALSASVSPCQPAGGTFVERTATLVERTVDQPGIGTGGPLATVRVCDALVTITVAGFGVEDFPALSLC
jgi:hypothetical protein